MFGFKMKETIVERTLKSGSKKERTKEWHLSIAEPVRQLLAWLTAFLPR